jgi:hypothetical protein
MSNIIYLVVKSASSYSDSSWQAICAFLDRQKADKYCEKANDGLELIRKAKIQLHEHIKVWDAGRFRRYPVFFLSHQESTQYLKLQEKSNKRSKKENVRFEELTNKMKTLQDERVQFTVDMRAEQKRFIYTLDFLTDEQKNNLTDPTRLNYYETDADYNVEEVEVKD